MVSKLLGKETVLMVSRTRKRSYEYTAKSHKNPYSGVVVILVDRESGSASEVIAAGLQESGRAVVDHNELARVSRPFWTALTQLLG
jgi:C-terminal processing protease CtpA/Prc